MNSFYEYVKIGDYKRLIALYDQGKCDPSVNNNWAVKYCLNNGFTKTANFLLSTPEVINTFGITNVILLKMGL